MFVVNYGGKQGQAYNLAISDDRVVIRSKDKTDLLEQRPFEITPLSIKARMSLQALDLELRLNMAGVEIWRTKQQQNAQVIRDNVRTVLKAEPCIEFAGRVLVDITSEKPVIYTENFFIKFVDNISTARCLEVLQYYGLTVKRKLEYANNAFYASAPSGTGLAIFDLGQKLLAEPDVELCHPELIRETRKRDFFSQQWHLGPTMINGVSIDAHANVQSAWELSQGEGVTIAVIDDGVDIDHEEFNIDGKIVAPRDVTQRSDNPRPSDGNNHGTACAGVACAAGLHGASGVAPKAALMPIRLVSELGSQAEADAFVWATQNGADVIACSWGPPDGDWYNPNDPLHQQYVPLPDATRLAIDFAAKRGRDGKGCIIVFAAGNGNESVSNDGYASYSQVITVAASNDRGVKSSYSDYGPEVWCCFPSNDTTDALTNGIWTTDRTGHLGYNPGLENRGDPLGNYTNNFGGTSSACPGVAGVIALMLSVNSQLSQAEIREILKNTADKIDQENGRYDASGHSDWYGYGRVNARRAVEQAIALVPVEQASSFHEVKPRLALQDHTTTMVSVPIDVRLPISSITITVDIKHTNIGDLLITLHPPSSLGLEPIVLHDRQGGSQNDLLVSYTHASIPALAALLGKPSHGDWQFEINDNKQRHKGSVRSISIELGH
jgi:subtilisin family serine protease/subtilisin-like proprotein convertase family protein